MTNISFKFCPRCGTSLSDNARFCAQCGCNIAEFKPRTPLSARALTIIGATSVVLFTVAWYSQAALTGTAPTEKFKGADSSPQAAAELDAELKRLKEVAEKTPKEKAGWVAYAQALGMRLSEKGAPRELVFEAIGALRQILDIDPNDKDALLTMAEISFQQQAFAKSAEFYEKYLSLVPEDIDIRARYASSLSFVGKFDESLKELERVLTVKPTHFHALAYSAVTYAEMGNRAKAKEVGARALKSAPNEEAKARFSDFLESLDKPESDAPKGDSHQHAAPSKEFDGVTQAVVDHVKGNPVAGKKFVDAKLSSPDTLVISLDNFPMSAMPPFVKQKFVNGIKEKAFVVSSPLKKVVIFDSSTQAEIETITSASH
jgi:tetratricopeptide (TPR) repeat protein